MDVDKFLDVTICDTEIVGSFSQLFSEEEKERAEMILKSIEGLSIISAQLILKKCEKALLQTKI